MDNLVDHHSLPRWRFQREIVVSHELIALSTMMDLGGFWEIVQYLELTFDWSPSHLLYGFIVRPTRITSYLMRIRMKYK